MGDVYIYEDDFSSEAVYFDKDGDLICASWTSSEGGESMNVLDEALQRKLYEALKAKFETKDNQ